jgi:hypothetical protein
MPPSLSASRAASVPLSEETRAPAPATDRLLHWDRDHVWHAFTQMQEYEPLLIESGQGAWLFDTEGHRYLDGSASMWCNLHGHRHPRLDAAIRGQLDRVAHTTNLGLSNPTTVEFARRLVEVAPDGLEKVFFSGDGSSAIEAALKMAFQFWLQAETPQPKRTRFIAIGEAIKDLARSHDLKAVDPTGPWRAPATAASRQPNCAGDGVLSTHWSHSACDSKVDTVLRRTSRMPGST